MSVGEGLIGHWPAAVGVRGDETHVPPPHGGWRFDMDFTLSLGVDTPLSRAPLGDLVAAYDATSRTGLTLGFAHLGGVTSNAPNERQVSCALDAGSEPVFTDLGRPGDAALIFSLASCRGSLFAGTSEWGEAGRGRVMRWDPLRGWQDTGIPIRCNAVTALGVHGDQLYAGSGYYRYSGSALQDSANQEPGGEILRLEDDGNWMSLGHLADRKTIGGLAWLEGDLYADSLYPPAGFFRRTASGEWLELPLLGNRRMQALMPHDGALFASSYDGGFVFRYRPDTGWEELGKVGENTQTYSFAVFGNRVHVGTWPSGRVYAWTGAGWEDTGRLGEELEVMGMIPYAGKLYAGTLPLAEVHRLDGDGWTRVGRVDFTPDVTYRRAWTSALHSGSLYWGTLPSGHVWRMDAGCCASTPTAWPGGRTRLTVVRRNNSLELYQDSTRVAVGSGDCPAARISTPLVLGGGPQGFSGATLDGIRLYSRALSADEIGELCATER